MGAGPGSVQRGIRRVFTVSDGKPLTSAALFAWAYPRATKLKLKHSVAIHLAAKALGVKAVRLWKNGKFVGSLGIGLPLANSALIFAICCPATSLPTISMAYWLFG